MRTIKLLLVAGIIISTIACGEKEIEEITIPETLYNKWELTELNHEPFDTTGFSQTPYLQFSKEESKMNGYAGCNNIFGGFWVKADSLKFAQVASTMMACPTLDFETSLIKALEKCSNYIITENTLTLYHEKEVLIKFSLAK